MRTLLVIGRVPLPPPLRDVVARGSTSIVERPVSELDAARPPADADRIVLWAAPGDGAIADLARAYSRGASAERKDALIVVAPEAAAAPSGLQGLEVFVWPRDEDRLKLAFMTGG
jgi:hypothetical protein